MLGYTSKIVWEMLGGFLLGRNQNPDELFCEFRRALSGSSKAIQLNLTLRYLKQLRVYKFACNYIISATNMPNVLHAWEIVLCSHVGKFLFKTKWEQSENPTYNLSGWWLAYLVGGFNTSQQILATWKSSPIFEVKIPKIFELPPPSKHSHLEHSRVLQ